MNTTVLMSISFAQFSLLPAWVVLLLKITAFLAVAWLLHLALRQANPRWLIFLWRGSIIGVMLMAVWTLGLPGFEIRIEKPKQIAITPQTPPPSAIQSDAESSKIITPKTIITSNTLPGRSTESISSVPINAREDDVQYPAANRLENTDVPVNLKSSIAWQTVLMIAWCVGMAAFVFRLTVGYIRLLRLLKTSQPVPEAIVAESRRIAAGLGCRREVRIRSSNQFSVPFLYGLSRPVVILPAWMCETNHSLQLSSVLAHELTHTRSFDLLWNVLMQFISIALWFHPLAWRIGSAHSAACDAVCDAVSASYIGDVQEYCRTLARVALEAAVPSASLGLSMARGCDVRNRLNALKKQLFDAPLKRRKVAVVAIFGLTVLALLAGLRFAADAQTVAKEPQSSADETAITPSKVFEKVLNAYKTMDTYKAEGTITTDMDTGSGKTSIETSFSFVLKKPNLFLITWTQKGETTPNLQQRLFSWLQMNGINPIFEKSRVIWSDGTQPYEYSESLHAYSKINSNRIGAIGVTTIPALFLKQQSTFSNLKKPLFEVSEAIDGEDCYVINGATWRSKKETWWISKSKHLIIKYSRSLSPPEGGIKFAELSDKQIEESVRAMGGEVSEENKKKMKDAMAKTKKMFNNMTISGSETVIYRNISSPELNKDDFKFEPPKGTELKETLYVGIFDKKNKDADIPTNDKPKKSQKTDSADSQKPGYRPLKIQVSDSEGKPLADAELTIRGVTDNSFGPFKFKTNAEGNAAVEVPEKDVSDCSINARKKEYVSAGASWGGKGIKVSMPDNFSFALEKGTVLGGIVRDEQRQPIAGAEVTISGYKSLSEDRRSASIYDKVKTDMDGKWQCDRNPKNLIGYGLEIKLNHPEFSAERFSQENLSIEELRSQTAVMTMRKGVTVEGTVTDPQGKPVASIDVGLYGVLLRSDCPRTKTDQNGRYRFAVADPGEYTVVAAAKNYAPALQNTTVAEQPRTVDLQLNQGEKIRLKIVDQSGKPIPGVTVSFLMHAVDRTEFAVMLDYETSMARKDYVSLTDNEGRWSRLWIPKKSMDFHIYKEGFISIQKSFAPDEREQVVTLEAGEWSVSGRIVDQDTKAPVKKFRVTEGRETGEGRLFTDSELILYESRPVANENGEYRLTWDRPDESRVVCIEADGYYPSKAQSLGNNDKQVTRNFELRKGENITGVVRSLDGKLLSDADVVLCTPSRGFSFRNGRVGSDQFTLVVRTGAGGHFTFPPQNDPFLIMAAHDLGFAQVNDIAAAKEITLQPWAKVEGTVTIDGKPGVKETVRIDYADLWGRPSVELTPAEQAAKRIFHYFEVQTDDKGHFVFDRAKPGKAKICRAVKLSQEGGMSSWTYVDGQPVDLVPGKTITMDIKGLDQAEIRERSKAAEKARTEHLREVPNKQEQTKRIEEAIKALKSSSPNSEKEHIQAALEILRNHPLRNKDILSWATAIRELITVGKPVVPILIDELDNTKTEFSLSDIGYALRGIGDPRAVPALIRTIPRLAGNSYSDCGLTIDGNPDLLKFIKQHDNSFVFQKYYKTSYDRPELFSYGRPINEIMPTLEKITNESHRWMEIIFADSEGYGIEQKRIKKIVFLKHAELWSAWWSKNWQKFVQNESEAQLDQTRKSLELFAASIEKMPQPKSLTEIPCGPNVKVSGGMNWGQMKAYNEFPWHSILDLGSGRMPMPPKELIQNSMGEPSQELAAWAEKEGADLIVVKITPSGGDKPYHAIMPLGMKVWRIDNDHYNNLQNELCYTNKVDLPKLWQGNIAQIDEKTGKYDEALTVSFLFITKEGVCGALQIQSALDKTMRGRSPVREGGWEYQFIYEDHAEQ